MFWDNLIEKTKTGKIALWQGFYKKGNKAIAVVSKHCNKKWIIFRKNNASGKHCLTALTKGDYILVLGSYSRLFVLNIYRYDSEGVIKNLKAVYGTKESLIEKVREFNTGLIFVTERMIKRYEQSKCPCWGEEKFKTKSEKLE